MKNDLENFDELPKLNSAPAVGDRVVVETLFGFQNDRRIGIVADVISSEILGEQEWGVVVRFKKTKFSRATKKYLKVQELRAI